MFIYILIVAIAASVIIVESAVQTTSEIDLWKGVPPNGPGPQGSEKVSSDGS